MAPVIDIETIALKSGAHATPEDGMCIMEAISYINREKFSDHPTCTCAFIASFLRSWNDRLNDEDRQKLKPYIYRVIGTANDGGYDRRFWLTIDWLIREYTPAWLDLAKLTDQAAALRALSEITDASGINGAKAAIASAKRDADAAWDAARDAAGAAAGAAARAAAWDAARAAARDAAGDAARDAAGAAAGAAARAAAWDAARAAAWDAAGDAAGAALRPTVVGLQESALRLLDRMIEAGKKAA
jgi:hypothetical protein